MKPLDVFLKTKADFIKKHSTYTLKGDPFTISETKKKLSKL